MAAPSEANEDPRIRRSSSPLSVELLSPAKTHVASSSKLAQNGLANGHEYTASLSAGVRTQTGAGAGLAKTERKKRQAEEGITRAGPAQPERPQDDWQVAYVWAFIIKFRLISQIPKLESIDDFERCLSEPVANRPDDVLEGVLIRFLTNLKPGLRNLDCTNIQHHLSNYIHEQLLSSEFTAWDPSPTNETPHGPCCDPSPERIETGRLRALGEPVAERTRLNPIKRMEERGGGLFEMDWRERARMLRQLVDWQFTHSDVIRGMINAESKLSAAKKGESVDGGIRFEPLGMDRGKNRIWALDYSGRLYKSGNPFKRPCPMSMIVASRSELEEQQLRYTTYGAMKPTKPSTSGKGKAAMAEQMAFKKLSKGVEDERVLAERLGEMMPNVEREEQRIQRARRKIAQAAEMAQLAELRSTRTRRPAKRIDYTDGAEFDEDDEYTTSRKRKEPDQSWKPVIPGERQSARLSATTQLNDDAYSVSGRSRGEETPPASAAMSTGGSGAEGRTRGKMKGYAWVVEVVPAPVGDGGEHGVPGGGIGDGAASARADHIAGGAALSEQGGERVAIEGTDEPNGLRRGNDEHGQGTLGGSAPENGDEASMESGTSSDTASPQRKAVGPDASKHTHVNGSPRGPRSSLSSASSVSGEGTG